MPSIASVFNYWKDKCITENGQVEIEGEYDYSKSIPVIEDWGESCCFGCNAFVGDELYENDWYEDTLKSDEPGALDKIWNSKPVSKNLQRAHIVPAACGGNNDPSNIFLLCKRCHDDAPDTIYTERFFRWCYERRHKMPGAMGLLGDAYNILSRTYGIKSPIVNLSDVQLDVNCGSHGGKVKTNSLVDALVGVAVERNKYINEIQSCAIRKNGDGVMEAAQKLVDTLHIANNSIQ